MAKVFCLNCRNLRMIRERGAISYRCRAAGSSFVISWLQRQKVRETPQAKNANNHCSDYRLKKESEG